MNPILTVTLNSELDVIASRQRARQIAAFCGFNHQDQTRVSTLVSELARIASPQGGLVHFSVTPEIGQQSLVVLVQSKSSAKDGNAIAGDAVYAHRSIRRFSAAQPLMEHCEVSEDEDGTGIILRKPFAANAPHLDAEVIRQAVSGLGALPTNVALSDATQQNRELTDVLEDLRIKQAELLQLSEQLEDTNRTVETLNRLLNDKAESLALADRRKDEFLSLLSHELRSPLSATTMAAQMLQQNAPDPLQTVKLGQLIGRQSSHMRRLVEDLLDVSRMGRGLLSIETQELDMRDAVEAAVEQLSSAADAKSHSLEVLMPTLACVIEGDRTRLTQVVGNILANSIRYTPQGGKINIVLQMHDDELSLVVTDNGIGIPPELLPHLFDMYVQAERPSDTRNGGLGLGLALVKNLVEIHKGSVSAASRGEGRGSIFTVVLPLAGKVGSPLPRA
jgi:signal transduction histidine kinase